METFEPSFPDPFEYVEWLVRARRMIYDYDLSESSRMTNSYNLMSANVEMLLPEKAGAGLHLFCREVKWNQAWAAHDQQCFHLLETTRIVDPHGMLRRAAGEGIVFCTFHVGSYRLTNSVLHQHDIDFSLVADNDFVSRQAAKVQALAEQLQRDYLKREPRPFEVIDAESSTGALRALRKLRDGRSLMIYIDGNTGVHGGFDDRSKYTAVDFLTKRLHARRGIAFLSYMGKCPIVPVVCVRTGWLTRELHVLDPIVPASGQERDDYCDGATQRLYSILESYLRTVPEQWEGWFYVHKFLDMASLPEPAATNCAGFDPMGIYCFNREMFARLHYGDQAFLFNRRTYLLHPIDRRFDQILATFETPTAYHELSFDGFDVAQSVLEELYERSVIVHSVAFPEST